MCRCHCRRTSGSGLPSGSCPIQSSWPWSSVAVMWVVLARTRFGLRTYAIGANPEAARRAGIPVDRHIVLLFAVMGTLCGLAAVIDVARFDTATVLANSNLLLGAIAAVVIGGTSLYGGRGRMSGTIVGALIPTVLLNGFVISASSRSGRTSPWASCSVCRLHRRDPPPPGAHRGQRRAYVGTITHISLHGCYMEMNATFPSRHESGPCTQIVRHPYSDSRARFAPRTLFWAWASASRKSHQNNTRN